MAMGPRRWAARCAPSAGPGNRLADLRCLAPSSSERAAAPSAFGAPPFPARRPSESAPWPRFAASAPHRVGHASLSRPNPWHSPTFPAPAAVMPRRLGASLPVGPLAVPPALARLDPSCLAGAIQAAPPLVGAIPTTPPPGLWLLSQRLHH